MKLKSLFAAALLALAPALALAAGSYTPGAPIAAFPPTGNELIPADTNLPAGQNPQTEAMNLNYIHAWARPFVVVPYAATVTPDYSTSSNQQITLTGNLTLANPTNLLSGGFLRFSLIQDATGSRTVTLGTNYKFAGGTAPTWSTGAGKKDVMTCTWDGTILICSALIDVR